MQTETKAERLLDLRRRFENGAQKTINQLCSEYGVSRRTVTRDLTTLSVGGLELRAEPNDEGEKIWSVPLRQRKINVPFNLTDLAALLMGRRLYDFLAGTLLEESLNKIYHTIEKALDREKDLHGARRLAKKVYLVSEAPKQLEPQHVECLDQCLTALLEEKLLDITYVNAKGERREHRLEPLTLTAFRRGLYLVGRFPGSNAIRQFALERCEEAAFVRGSSFPYPTEFDPQVYFGEALFIRTGTPQPVVLLFTPQSEPFVRLRRFHASQKKRIRKDGSVELTLQVPIGDELVYWLLSFGANVVVESPPELRDQVTEALRQTLARYETSASEE